jgi:hypothetical protein
MRTRPRHPVIVRQTITEARSITDSGKSSDSRAIGIGISDSRDGTDVGRLVQFDGGLFEFGMVKIRD